MQQNRMSTVVLLLVLEQMIILNETSQNMDCSVVRKKKSPPAIEKYN
jgi:hypothetical protein